MGVMIRYGFVANSSSSSFLITNYGDPVTLEEFLHIIRYHLEYYMVSELGDWYDITFEDVIKSAIDRDEIIDSGKHEYIYGDEDGDAVGLVLDYCLRSGHIGQFKWKYHAALR